MSICPSIVKRSDLTFWLNQFATEDRAIIRKLLPHYQFFTSDRVFELLGILYNMLKNDYHIDEATTLFVPIGYTAKSGNAITYFFRRQNNLKEDNFISLNDIKKNQLSWVKHIVFIDDFIGSGEYLEKLYTDFVDKLDVGDKNRITFISACVVGYEQGIEKVSSSTNIKICVAHKIPYSLQPLHKDSKIFDEKEKEMAKQVLLKYNQPLKPNKPLGHGDVQGLVSFFFATPNNTLPIFWSSNDNWHPLFPRGDSRRNPDNLILLPDFLQEKNVFSANFNSKIDYSKETLQALLNCFLALDKVNIMAEVFYRLNINETLIPEILKVIDNCQNLTHEEKPICTSILIIDKKYVETIKNAPEFIANLSNVTVKETMAFKEHLEVLDGWAHTLVVESTGNVLGILNYSQSTVKEPANYLSNKYEGFENTSQLYHGLLLVFTDNNKVLIYYNGDPIMTKKGRDWHMQGNLKDMAIIAVRHSIAPDVLNTAIQLAFETSNRGKGALLCVGDEQKVMTYATPLKHMQFSFKDNNICTADKNVLLTLAAQDGAVIISSDGRVLKYMHKLVPPNDGSVEIDGGGTRHNAAKIMSFATNAICITVSVEGHITIYENGNRVLRVMG
ncbi:MAG: DNA integrity scanning protein DisA nucleotide-binding domain protein [Nitrososphaerota archaeon]|jgi:hypothetical protein|nr:DNA integrity scanning protein DisA nucleotide-binding domain protein [Nitrososphaerota archaeon]